MANHASALKRARQNEKRNARNRAYRTRVRSVVKQVRQAIDAGDADAAQTALSKAVPVIDKAASKGVLPQEERRPQGFAPVPSGLRPVASAPLPAFLGAGAGLALRLRRISP